MLLCAHSEEVFPENSESVAFTRAELLSVRPLGLKSVTGFSVSVAVQPRWHPISFSPRHHISKGELNKANRQIITPVSDCVCGGRGGGATNSAAPPLPEELFSAQLPSLSFSLPLWVDVSMETCSLVPLKLHCI